MNDARTRKWLSIVTLGVTGFVLLLVLFWAWTAAIQPAAAKCSNAPARSTSIPQPIEVSVCVAGFLLGRLTARPKIRRRRELRDWTSGRPVGLLPDMPRIRAAVWAQACLTAALFLITWLLAFEAITLARGVWPITYYLRCANEAAPLRALTAAAAFCFLAGRWFWLPEPPEGET